MQKIKRDGHIHTPFCPHGTKDELEAYVEEGLQLGLEEMSFTEHFPLPKGICDPIFQAECALEEAVIPKYFEEMKALQEKYKGKMKINKGFEIDYIEGREEEICTLLNRYGSEIEDSILSVHFVYHKGEYYAIDYEPEVERLMMELSNVKQMYDLYFQTVIKSIEADLGTYKPKRIGHLGLVRIFQKKWPINYEDNGLYQEIIKKIKDGGYEIDLNVSGLKKAYCGETYPSSQLLEMIKEYEIPYVIGSDSHGVHQMALLKTLES